MIKYERSSRKNRFPMQIAEIHGIGPGGVRGGVHGTRADLEIFVDFSSKMFDCPGLTWQVEKSVDFGELSAFQHETLTERK